MTERKKKKKGFTLTELVIVLLVVSIMTGMVISFTVLMSGYARQSNNRLAIAEEIQHAELVVRHWISSFDREDCDIFVSGMKKIYAHESVDLNTRYTISIAEDEEENRRIEASYPDGKPRYAILDYIYGVEFHEMKDADTGRTLIYCTFVYLVPGFNDTQTPSIKEHTFLVSTRVAF